MTLTSVFLMNFLNGRSQLVRYGAKRLAPKRAVDNLIDVLQPLALKLSVKFVLHSVLLAARDCDEPRVGYNHPEDLRHGGIPNSQKGQTVIVEFRLSAQHGVGPLLILRPRSEHALSGILR